MMQTLSRAVGAVALLAALSACALGVPKLILPTAEFNAAEDSPYIDVLDYRHVAGQFRILVAQRERVRLGQSFPGGNSCGFLPRSEYLSAKWRLKDAGIVLEDRVDLRQRLPKNLRDCHIHFACHGRHLHVFAESPWDGKLHPPGASA